MACLGWAMTGAATGQGLKLAASPVEVGINTGRRAGFRGRYLRPMAEFAAAAIYIYTQLS